MRAVFTTVTLAGTGLVIISLFWTSLVGGRRNWSDAQAKDYADTLAEMHRLSGAVAQVQQMPPQPGQASPQAGDANARLATAAESGAPVDPNTATADRLATQLEVVKQHYATQRAALDAARSHGEGLATFMRWFGIVFLVVGLTGLLALQSQGDNSTA